MNKTMMILCFLFTSLPTAWAVGQSGDDSGGGAADPNDPSAILTQFQMQNIFTPETYDATGYSNTVVLQPVLPFPVALPRVKEFFPAHILRPTLPIISPTADPDGVAGAQGGLGDLTVLDAYVHPVEGFGTVLFGYNVVCPTSTDTRLGLGEWQAGPIAAVINTSKPKTIRGTLVQSQFSMESDASSISVQPIFVKNLPEKWYVGWGTTFWTFDTSNGNYNMPINTRVGRVTKLGEQPVNIFLEPFYTPAGLRSGPASQWGVKLNITLLFPDKKSGPLLGSMFSGRCNCCN